MNSFDNIIKSKLENYRANAPENVLLKVKENYPNPKATVPQKLLLTGMAVGIAVLSVFIFSELLTNDNDEIIAEKVEVNINTNEFVHIAKPHEYILTEEIEKQALRQILTEIDPVAEQNQIAAKKVEFFSTSDTLICGKFLVIDDSNDRSAIVYFGNNRIQRSKDNKFYIAKTDKKTEQLIYISNQNNLLLSDTMNVTFISKPEPELSILTDINCPDDKLEIYIRNVNNYKVQWNADNGIISKKDRNIYEIHWSEPGTKYLQISFDNNGCETIVEKQFNVPARPELNVITQADYCNKNLGKIIVKNLSYDNSYFILNDKINNTGVFESLKSGSYNIGVLFNDICSYSQDVFVGDSLQINAKFKIDENISDQSRYYFVNKTRIDNFQYRETSENINFAWFVNDDLISIADEADYAFNTDGIYEVQLRASISDYCVDVYTEKIIISETKFLAPNIFTPNDDGIGDFFIVSYTRPINNFRGIISNRSGEVIFEWTDINRGWDGMINGINPASEGVYFYVLRGEDISGRPVEKKGTVRLVRD